MTRHLLLPEQGSLLVHVILLVEASDPPWLPLSAFFLSVSPFLFFRMNQSPSTLCIQPPITGSDVFISYYVPSLLGQVSHLGTNRVCLYIECLTRLAEVPVL